MTPGIHYWPNLLDLSEDQCKLKLRCMELEAYSSIVSVLRARGPLTEEKLNFMKQCSKEFHISQERHKVEIRKASNDELLNTIAEVLYGPNTGSKWFIEGRRLAPVLNIEPRQSVYIELANKMAELAREHNAKLPPYSEYKDDEIEIDNAHLKQEEEAMLEELEKEVKAKEAASILASVTAVPTSTEPTVGQATESTTQAPSIASDIQMVEITDDISNMNKLEELPLSSVGGPGGVTLHHRHPPTPPHKGDRGRSPGIRAGAVEGGNNPPGKSPGSGSKRKNKRSLSIEAYDETCTPPKRFSNIPPPRIPATPVSQRPPRFQSNSGASSQPSPRIVVLPGVIHQQHSSMTHINTGSASVSRKPLVKQTSAPTPPPIISKIHRPRMFTPMKGLFGPQGQSMGFNQSRPSTPDSSSMGVVSSTSGSAPNKGGNNSMSTPKGGMSSGMSTPKGGSSSGVAMGTNKGGVPKGNVSSSAGGLGSKGGSLASPSVGATGVGKGNQQNNMILVQKGNKTVTGVSSATSTTLANRITIATPTNKKPVESLTKFLAANKASRPSASPSTAVTSASNSTPPSAKPVYLKSTPSSSQNNVILVDITQDQLSGSLSVEDLLKVSGLSSSSTTSSSGTTIKTPHSSSSMPNIIKLQNPKSLGALPANIQQIKIIKSSGSKLVFPTSVGCTMESVLSSLAQSSTVSSSTPVYTSSSVSGTPRMMVAPTPGVRPGLRGLVPRALLPVPRGSVATGPGPRPVSASPSPTPVSSTYSTVTTSGVSTGSSGGTSSQQSSVATSSTPSSLQQSNSSNMSTSISSGSQLADWLSNYVVSDKDIETDSNSPLFEDVNDKGKAIDN
uniref:BRCA2-interacting transcriptional repressor EMSY n=1 Tax=Cacopsylla melanoneura TaxID=428564 RepID=A0A8D9EJ56_9HEMI